MRIQVASTWPEPELLSSVRSLLDDADEALLCVAFTNKKGVHLLEPQFKRLGSSCRVLVTNVFADPAPALAQLSDWGSEVRLLNPSGGTYHPKIYLAGHGTHTQAFIGSANLTSGLLTNIEVGVRLVGERSDVPIAEAWRIGEAYWQHPAATPWISPVAVAPSEAMATSLLTAIRGALPEGTVIPTVSRGKPNTIAQISSVGVYIKTERSGEKPELVEAWMLELGAEVLLRDGQLTNRHLLHDLHVHRSSAVCAMLAQLPEVEIVSTNPIELRLAQRPTWADEFVRDIHAED